MKVYRSNRAERLVDMLAQVVQAPIGDPMSPEAIVVQSRGMQRWVSMGLASRLGVWANPSFEFPRTAMENLFAAAAVDGEDAERMRAGAAAFQEDAMLWSIAACLRERLGLQVFAPLARYLRGDDSGERIFQLAERVARVFDDYALYRPQLVLEWERGEGESWQPVLWRALVERLGPYHTAGRAARYFDAVRQSRLRLAELPQRLSLFGVSTLPPLYLRSLAALPDELEVHLFMLSPCSMYWGDVQSSRRNERAAARMGQLPPARSELELAEGHGLLASFGQLGSEFSDQLEELQGEGIEEAPEDYAVPEGQGVLQALQRDVLELNSGSDRQPVEIDPLDRSVAIHACHGPMREVQVLHDQLTELFETTDTLPGDVVVMTPDVEAYAPIVEAVFGVRQGRHQIPFQVSDRGVLSSHEVVDGFFRVLEVLPSRMPADAVLDLLAVAPVRRRFGIEAEDLDQIRAWVADAGIRWGVDAEHRSSVGQPPLDTNTWRFVLDRLLLGYAVEGQNLHLFHGRLPHDDVEGGETELLGKLCEFCHCLFGLRGAVLQPQPLEDWRRYLVHAQEVMLDPSPATAFEAQAIVDAMDLLCERARHAQFDEPVDLRTVLRRLEVALGDVLSPRLGARGFLSGGVTFCQLVPMRSIPFRVVCLLGMNDGAFPRNSRPLGFDLMAQQPLRGDRSRRNDDRYLFLEAIISARDRLLISYVGQGIHDNQPRPPSVVVSELLDTMARRFCVPGTEQREAVAAMEERFVVRHPLQPFSPRYFARPPEDERLFSYGVHDALGAASMAGPRSDPPFLSGAVAEMEQPTEAMDLARFEGYLSHPARTFLQNRLGLYLGDDARVTESREPIELDGLDKWQLGTALLDHFRLERGEEDLLAASSATGRLPLGTPGTLAYQELAPVAASLWERARGLAGGERLPPLEIDADIAGQQVAGILREVYPEGHMHVLFSRLGTRSELVHWLRHLLLNYEVQKGGRPEYPATSYWVGRAKEGMDLAVVCFDPVADAEAELRSLFELLRLARVGCLPLLDRASRAYGQARFGSTRPLDHEGALEAARTAFESKTGDQTNAYVQQVYPDFDRVLHDPGPVGFAEVATRIYKPLFAHRTVS